MNDMFTGETVFIIQLFNGWLNELASWNMFEKFVTLLTSQPSRPVLLKLLGPLDAMNIADMFVTALMSHELKFGIFVILKHSPNRKLRSVIVTAGTSNAVIVMLRQS